MDESALNNNVLLEDDRIRSMYANRSIFISGGTGFMGKVLVEKLLRYVLVKCEMTDNIISVSHDFESLCLFAELVLKSPKSICSFA